MVYFSICIIVSTLNMPTNVATSGTSNVEDIWWFMVRVVAGITPVRLPAFSEAARNLTGTFGTVSGWGWNGNGE